MRASTILSLNWLLHEKSTLRNKQKTVTVNKISLKIESPTIKGGKESCEWGVRMDEEHRRDESNKNIVKGLSELFWFQMARS